MTGQEKRPASPRAIRAALIGMAMLVVAGGAAFWAASRGTGAAPSGAVAVTVTATGCEPMALSVPAGPASFEIANRSDRPLEWEILDGVMVVAERENILPGYRATLTERLRPGEYAITCGLLTNPRGTLTVTPTAQSESVRTAPPPHAFVAALAEYRVYVMRQSAALSRASAELHAAVAAGDLERARQSWQDARLAWVRLAPVAALNADLASRIDMRAEELPQGAASPDFSGLHRIRAGLWGDHPGTDGLGPVTAALMQDVTALAERLRQAQFRPADLAGIAARRAQLWHDTATADLAATEAAARAEGVSRPLKLVLPLLAEAAPDQGRALNEALDALTAAPGDAARYEAVAALARDINARLGLEG